MYKDEYYVLVSAIIICIGVYLMFNVKWYQMLGALALFIAGIIVQYAVDSHNMRNYKHRRQ